MPAIKHQKMCAIFHFFTIIAALNPKNLDNNGHLNANPRICMHVIRKYFNMIIKILPVYMGFVQKKAALSSKGLR